MTALMTMRHRRKDGADTTSQWRQDDTGGQFPLDDRPSKRQKRGRYVSKAWYVSGSLSLGDATGKLKPSD